MKILFLFFFVMISLTTLAQESGFDPIQETIREQQKHETLSYMSARKKAEALRRHAILQHKKSEKSGESRAIKPLNQVAPESLSD